VLLGCHQRDLYGYDHSVQCVDQRVRLYDAVRLQLEVSGG
jgi:hypothetical protein